ncbi:heme-binding protein [Chryseobacterium indologenes]|uniref:GlcG/HbpS family heme-binding protein n=1 Tax=Chryseobacterium indologenes TaxID=253 RepID=UPI000F506F1B|nr:heme-binding protein [Chryseobacterium indologenes]AYZ35775.1 heme-binding protein [Chryseobacterium indologenes]MBF6644548.1 heme-binding protein [Chryseobacterium indologenes]MBU3047970.1 heme-binding protein [Chryseobacterium indologenes]MEB4759541.1 heme-binding protein [Chryseobacterium indologenes]QQQ71753.1 heme-binding protein [Chryseobacterium indologenes]
MDLSYDLAQKALQSAVEKAKSLGIPVSVAVVDKGGHIVAFARLDSVYGVIEFAIKKARTAAMFGVDSDMMGSIVAGAEMHGYGMINSNDGLLTIAGGVVIKDYDGKIMGAIASSGGSPGQDKEIASAGASVIA